MNDEYLWSKKGSDPEIERLEGLLYEFRFEPGAMQTFVPQTAEKPTGIFSKRFAWVIGLAAPSFSLALFGFWFFTAGSAVSDVQVLSLQAADAVTHVRNVAPAPLPALFNENKKETVQKVPVLKVRPTLVKTIHRSRKTKTDRTQALTAMNLTREEKYAYDRLMLALSITGTKLKVVQDTIDRSHDLEKRSIRNDK